MAKRFPDGADTPFYVTTDWELRLPLMMVQATLQSGGLTPRGLAAIATAVLACSLVAIYFLHFKSANEAPLRRAVSATDLPPTLANWATWHRARVYIVVAAFGLSLVTLVA